MTAEEIDALLEAAKPSIIESLKKEITQSISWGVKNKAAELVANTVSEWLSEHIVPEIHKSLVESKDGLIAIAKDVASKMNDELVKGMITTLSEKLQKSWDRKKIFSAMFE